MYLAILFLFESYMVVCLFESTMAPLSLDQASVLFGRSSSHVKQEGNVGLGRYFTGYRTRVCKEGHSENRWPAGVTLCGTLGFARIFKDLHGAWPKRFFRWFGGLLFTGCVGAALRRVDSHESSPGCAGLRRSRSWFRSLRASNQTSSTLPTVRRRRASAYL